VHLVHNEQTKFSAAWLNALATALVTAGSLAPLAALIYGLGALRLDLGFVIFLAVACLIAGLGLHFAGRMTLRRLRE
jgi:hypothetical protein